MFLYYARAVDISMLPAVTAVASEQSKPTQAVLAAAKRLIAYAASYPANEIVFSACDMILYGQSDASYLSRSNARSVAGGIFYLGNRNAPTQVNGAIVPYSSIIPVVVSSAAEAEYGGLFASRRAAWCPPSQHPGGLGLSSRLHSPVMRQRMCCGHLHGHGQSQTQQVH